MCVCPENESVSCSVVTNSLQPQRSPPGFSVHGIFQGSILEWVAISFSRKSSQSGIEPESPALKQILYRLSHQGGQVCVQEVPKLKVCAL